MTASANFDPLAYLGGVSAHLGDRARGLCDKDPARHWARGGSGVEPGAVVGSPDRGDIGPPRDRAVALYRQRFVQHGAAIGVHVDNRDLDSLLDYRPFLALVAEMPDG